MYFGMKIKDFEFSSRSILNWTYLSSPENNLLSKPEFLSFSSSLEEIDMG